MKNQTNLSPIARAVRASLLGLSLTQGVSQAATIEVDIATDDFSPGCTLRDALSSINLGQLIGGCFNTGGDFSADDTIIFADDLAGKTITLGNQLSIIQDVKIDASTVNGVSVSGNNDARVLYIYNAASSVNVSINNLTIIHGFAENNGAGIYFKDGTLNIDDSTISSNSADGGGGGISLTDATLTLDKTTISNNSSYSSGGGIRLTRSNATISNSTLSSNETSSTGGGASALSTRLDLQNSTISGNSASEGGGISALRNFNFDFPTLTLNNSTVSNNDAENLGGGVYLDSGTLNLQNSIIANSNNGEDCFIKESSLKIGYSIIEDGSCNNVARAVDPKLAPLANNGGPTKTHALQSGSPAIDQINIELCTSRDQRGLPRDGPCDIGAYEYQRGFFVIPFDSGKVVVLPE